jgi:hypothetical protein
LKIFFDEDNGTGIPRSIKLLRAPNAMVEFPTAKGLIKKGEQDREWIPKVGSAGFLVFSQNYHMLENEAEFELIVSENIGIVFLTNGSAKAWESFRLIQAKWTWLQEIDRHEPRPFAFLVDLGGRVRQYDVALGPRRPKPRPQRPKAQKAGPVSRAAQVLELPADDAP